MTTTTTDTIERAPTGWAGQPTITIPENMTIECHEHAAAVFKYAADSGRTAELQTMLDRLGRVGHRGRVRLFSDFAPQSFTFAIEVERDGAWVRAMFGGLIFHGSHDGGGNGGAPSYSVSLEPGDGWQIHT